jgi:inward rectifier potassium channel
MQDMQNLGSPPERTIREKATRVRLGSYEFKKKGVPRFDFRDPYHFAVALSWPQFLWALLALYLAVNLLFAALFWLAPGSVANAQPNSFADALFFSIETLGTVGYGEMYPATAYARVVAAAEILSGLAVTAILTGLTFVRFSRPRARLVFAPHPVVAMHLAKPTLMLRVGNGRISILMDATAKLNVLLTEENAMGKPIRRARELRLERAHLPLFPLTWTLMHVLDERSPLRGYDTARAIEAQMHIFVTLEARDPTLSTMVHDIRSYGPQDFRFGMRYANVIAVEGSTVAADLGRIGEIEPDVGDSQESGWSEHEEKPQ